ncbi:MAG: DUF805 domain-containing protein [Rhizomicrobium sp.]|jgi:uncharacterized membrane protein YhaH (DUF805 family)
MGNLLGRSDRWEYWTSVALLTVGQYVFNAMHVHTAVAALFVMWLVIWARRLHDIDVSGWMALVPAGAMVAAILIGWFVGGNEFRRILAAGTANRAIVINVRVISLLGFVFISLAIQYGFSIWLGIRAGDAQDNRFGPARGAAVAKIEK